MTDLVKNKIAQFRQHQTELSAELAAGSSDVAKLKEFTKIQKVLDLADEYDKCKLDAAELKSWYNEIDDQETKDACKEEYDKTIVRLDTLSLQLTEAFIDKDPNDDYNAIFEIAGEVGGDEANLFAHNLFEMYVRYAHKCGYTVDVVEEKPDKVSFIIVGDGAYGTFKFESGIHRVQRVPETEAKGRMHTSTAAVMVTPELETSDFEIDENDIDFQTCHSSGAGGQNINKVSTAVRATYKPTGLTVFCQARRTQLQNKAEAVKIIASKIKAEREEKEKSNDVESRRSILKNCDRSDKIRTYNYPQNRITDHRIGLSLLKLDRIMFGDMDELITALHVADMEAKTNE